MWFYVQMWLPVWTVALTAAICFRVASFIMGRSVKPHQLTLATVPVVYALNGCRNAGGDHRHDQIAGELFHEQVPQIGLYRSQRKTGSS